MNRWNADIFYRSGEGYSAIFSFATGVEILIEPRRTWREFSEQVTKNTGIRIPGRNSYEFAGWTRHDLKIAGIDASHTRPGGCIVTMNDRLCGWTRTRF